MLKMPINRIEDGVPPAKYTYITKSIIESDTVLAGQVDDTIITPPAGKLWQILNMRLTGHNLVFVGATSGYHRFKFIVGGVNTLYGKSSYDSALLWDWSRWFLANLEQQPTTETASLMALTNINIIKGLQER